MTSSVVAVFSASEQSADDTFNHSAERSAVAVDDDDNDVILQSAAPRRHETRSVTRHHVVSMSACVGAFPLSRLIFKQLCARIFRVHECTVRDTKFYINSERAIFSVDVLTVDFINRWIRCLSITQTATVFSLRRTKNIAASQ